MQFWTFSSHGNPPLFGFGTESNARRYTATLNAGRATNRFDVRRPTSAESEQIARMPVELTFTISDQLAKALGPVAGSSHDHCIAQHRSEHETKVISERIKAELSAAKLRSVP
jgi:hypothetical protein